MPSSTYELTSQPGLRMSQLISQRADVVEKEVQMRMRFDHLLPGDVKRLFEAEMRAVLELAAVELDEADDYDG